MDKEYLIRFTEKHPEIFSEFKKRTAFKFKCLNGAGLESINVKELCQYLTKKLEAIPVGTSNATQYHRLIIGILEMLLYPSLSNPQKEVEIHDGRKRIDIVFNNAAEKGFFCNLPEKDYSLTCLFIAVKCKNYTAEVANPELDQLSGRFSGRRGRVGILTCRQLDNNEKFMQRCADTLHDDRGLIIPICDVDLKKALLGFPEKGIEALEQILREKYEKIVFMK